MYACNFIFVFSSLIYPLFPRLVKKIGNILKLVRDITFRPQSVIAIAVAKMKTTVPDKLPTYVIWGLRSGESDARPNKAETLFRPVQTPCKSFPSFGFYDFYDKKEEFCSREILRFVGKNMLTDLFTKSV